MQQRIADMLYFLSITINSQPMTKEILRKRLGKHFTGSDEVAFIDNIPSNEKLSAHFHDIESAGIYMHIPFCDKICPYCPYNKEKFTESAAAGYLEALTREIDHYAALWGDKPITSFYIGGGTPTTLVGKGLEKIIEQICKRFNISCGIHMESHPNHLTHERLRLMSYMGVDYLSIGVEAFQDKHLLTLERPYDVNGMKKRVSRAVAMDFDCVNIDYIFDLPGQTAQETEAAGREMIELGIHQAATYPLFYFPYTRMGKSRQSDGQILKSLLRRRKMLKILEDIFYGSGFERSSVWAFTRKGTDKYCSVTVPMYLGLGASGGTYLKDIFYVNTFSVSAYTNALLSGRSPIALSVDLTEKMQMAGWLYWRFYETHFQKADFRQRFGIPIESKYGRFIRMLSSIGYLKSEKNGTIRLTDKGTYWLHAFEDFFSIDYISKLWGTAGSDPWPEKVVL
jgi:coproporphyrinogen III oxidase-like Fe-S oxidoreductase